MYDRHCLPRLTQLLFYVFFYKLFRLGFNNLFFLRYRMFSRFRRRRVKWLPLLGISNETRESLTAWRYVGLGCLLVSAIVLNTLSNVAANQDPYASGKYTFALKGSLSFRCKERGQVSKATPSYIIIVCFIPQALRAKGLGVLYYK